MFSKIRLPAARSAALAALLVWFGALPAPASQFLPVTVEELATNAQLVVRGTVQSQSCQRDEAGRIYTKVELAVAEVWKGSLATNRFTIVHSGGVLGEECQGVSGQVEFRVGEEVVAFLVLNRRGEGVCLGLALGKFEIQRDSVSGERYAHNPVLGSPPPVPSTRGKLAVSHMPLSRLLTVNDLKQRVQSAGK